MLIKDRSMNVIALLVVMVLVFAFGLSKVHANEDEVQIEPAGCSDLYSGFAFGCNKLVVRISNLTDQTYTVSQTCGKPNGLPPSQGPGGNSSGFTTITGLGSIENQIDPQSASQAWMSASISNGLTCAVRIFEGPVNNQGAEIGYLTNLGYESVCSNKARGQIPTGVINPANAPIQPVATTGGQSPQTPGCKAYKIVP